MHPHTKEPDPAAGNPHRPASDPLILVTNDDGITSPGLRAAVRAALPLGEVLVVAPDRQWSGAGRSFLRAPSAIESYPLLIEGQPITAYQVGASPALLVMHALLVLAPRPPALVISGINYGENVGSDISSSGTVGAVLQAAAYGVPALAASLQTPKEMHGQLSDSVDFSVAAHFTRLFARRLLKTALPFDVDALKVDVPADATYETPWRLTRASRHAYYVTVPPERSAPSQGTRVDLDYTIQPRPELTEPDSDIFALRVGRVVSVTPLSIDLTARACFSALEQLLRRTGPP